MVIPPDVVPYVNLALNVLCIVIVAALAVWLRAAHVSNVELKGQLLGMVLAFRLTINGGEGVPPDTIARAKELLAAVKPEGESP